MTRNARNTPDKLQASIALVQDTLDRIARYLTQCGEDIAKRGLFVDATVLDSHRKPKETRKANEYLRAQRELLKSQKVLNAYLQKLHDQLEAATATTKSDDWSELD